MQPVPLVGQQHPSRAVADWLASEADPAVGELARRDLLGLPSDPGRTLTSPVVRALLDGLLDERTLLQPYGKWAGAHWRLVSLVELEIASGNEITLAACDRVLEYWVSPARLDKVRVIDGRARRCASQEGNAVAVACRLGTAQDDRVQRLVEHLLRWQWPDGGWNCDPTLAVTHSSFHETLPALWGLTEFADATGDPAARAAGNAAARLLLEHRLVFSRRSGAPIHPSFLVAHYPPYWHYDVLQALLVISRAGFGGDPRTSAARRVVGNRRRRNGRWHAGRRWWRPPGASGRHAVEAVDWGEVADQMVTLNALRVGADR